MSLIETVPVTDVFASDLARVEILGSNARFILFAKHFPEEGAAAIHVVVAKIIVPVDVIPAAIARVLFALGHAAVSPMLEWPKRLN